MESSSTEYGLIWPGEVDPTYVHPEPGPLSRMLDRFAGTGGWPAEGVRLVARRWYTRCTDWTDVEE